MLAMTEQKAVLFHDVMAAGAGRARAHERRRRASQMRDHQALRRRLRAARRGPSGRAGRDPRPRSARTARASRRSCASWRAPSVRTPARWPSTAPPTDPRTPHDAREPGHPRRPPGVQPRPAAGVAENLLLGQLPDAGPGIVDWPAAHRAAGESLAEPGVRGRRHASARRPPGRLAAPDGGDRQGAARRPARGHPRRALGRALEPRAGTALQPILRAFRARPAAP